MPLFVLAYITAKSRPHLRQNKFSQPRTAAADCKHVATRSIRLRYDAECHVCGTALVAGLRADWDSATKAVTCEACASPSDPWATTWNGGSVAANLDQLAASSSPIGSRGRAFAKGAEGERLVGAALEAIPAAKVLHSRRHGNGDIDHIVVAASGVWAVDAKSRSGDITMPLAGSLEDLRVNNRRPKRELESIRRQVDTVASRLPADVRVHGVVCITGARWPARRLVRSGRIMIAEPNRLRTYIARRSGILTWGECGDLATRLAAAFPAIGGG